MKKQLLAAALGLALTFTFGCDDALKGEENGLTDSRDGKKYKTVKIGEQIWMAENLSYNATGSKCYGEGGKVDLQYEYCEEGDCFATLSNAEVQANCAKYGKLYNWSAAKSACPAGWHLPTNAEWNVLLKFVDGEKGGNGEESSCGAGTCYHSYTAGGYLRSSTGWNGTDDFGFSALPGGLGTSDGIFESASPSSYQTGYWWSDSEVNGTTAYYRNTGDGQDTDPSVHWYEIDKSKLLSVRCLKK